MNVSRRGFLTGGAAVVLSAPAIVRASSLMPISVAHVYDLSVPAWCPPWCFPADGRLLPKTAFSELHSVIANTWGGDGASFRLPNLRSKVLPSNVTLQAVIDTKTGALQMVLPTTG